MRDDILIIDEIHRKAASEVFEMILPTLKSHTGKYMMTIAGESGAGKSEIASALADLMRKANIPAYIIQQDDYFEFPPKTNARMREKDIGRIGPREVRIELINHNLSSILSGKDPVEKPLVIFSEDKITTEEVSFEPYKVIILEGTYTTLAKNIDCRIFIDRDMNDTRADRLKRNREKQDDYLEQILRIEHDIISRHKERADIVVTRDFTAVKKS
jgi:uridine kinase